jgi:hypothetical protein
MKNDPAFPVDVYEYNSIGDKFLQEAHIGLTKREYFAAKAMQALVTKSHGQDSIGGAKGVPLIAKYAVEFADALIKELEKTNGR